ncbi:MAG TPA: hypothetical protein VGU90_15055, partial [Terriglobales bacterium]|nr:hypothetical protein [Terriglobales bacterium]
MMAKMTAFGNGRRRWIYAVAVAAALSNLTATPSRALPSYDGLWSVSIVTEKGDCDRGYRYPIRITRGVLSNAGDTAFTIIGNVRATGLIRVTVSHGSASASGLGRLAGNVGSGSWAGG